MSQTALAAPDRARAAQHPADGVQLFGLPLSTVSWFLMFMATLDAWTTDRLVRLEFGREVNPVMEWAHGSFGTLNFVLGKVLLTALCLLWMNHRAPAREARLAAIVALAIYVPVTGLHVVTTSTLPGI